MAKGLYQDDAGWVRVDYDQKFQMLMKKNDYDEHGYKPRHESLPTKQKYVKASRAKRS